MAFLSKFDKFNRLISGWFEWFGLAGFLMMMFITCIDVIGAKLFRTPILGAIDIVMLSQVVAISFATASALILGRHVCVEFFMLLLPKRAQAAIDSIICLLGLALFILIVWRLCYTDIHFKWGGRKAQRPAYPFILLPMAWPLPVFPFAWCFYIGFWTLWKGW